MGVQRTTIYFSDPDRNVVEQLRTRYGFATASQAIRFALRAAAGFPPEAGVPTPEPRPPSAPAARCPAHGAEIALLTEQLAASQEELRLLQDELNQAQQELHYRAQELQNLNRFLLECAPERPRCR